MQKSRRRGFGLCQILRRVGACLLAALLLTGGARAAAPEVVTFAGPAGVTLKAWLYRPASAAVAARPAIIALHGCGGNMRADGTGFIARVPDWTERFLAAGYTVLWPDSFGSRGLGPQCNVASRDINPAMRATDVAAAAAWLATQPDIDRSKIALVGWSNGGSTALRAVATSGPPADYALAIAFYPGCRPIVERESRDGRPWASRVPLTILMGAADDWTPPEPCRTLGSRQNVRYIEYPDAYHDFDAPNAPIRVRKGLAYTANNSGQAHVGTNPAARAAVITEVMQQLASALK